MTLLPFAQCNRGNEIITELQYVPNTVTGFVQEIVFTQSSPAIKFSILHATYSHTSTDMPAQGNCSSQCVGQVSFILKDKKYFQAYLLT